MKTITDGSAAEKDGAQVLSADFARAFADALASGAVADCARAADALYAGEGAEKNRTLSLRLYCAGADNGDAYCAYSAGFQYLAGEGAEKNAAHAAYYFKEAANGGYAEAKKRLRKLPRGARPQKPAAAPPLGEKETALSARAGDVLHDLGEEERAYACYRFAAENGRVSALNNMGAMRAFGVGTAVDAEGALYCYLKAARADNGAACANLARLFLYGQGFEPSAQQAFTLFVLARAFGKKMDADIVARIAAAYPAVPPRQDGAPHGRDYADAFLVTPDYFGDPDAQLALGAQKDGAPYLMMSAMQGNAHAMFALYARYTRDAGFVRQNAARSFAWLYRAAEAGLPGAALALARECADAQKDADAALYWAREAAQRDPDAASFAADLEKKGAHPVKKEVRHDYAADAYDMGMDADGPAKRFLIYIAAVNGCSRAIDDLKIASRLFDDPELSAVEDVRRILRERARALIEGGIEAKRGRTRAQYVAFLGQCADEKRPGRDYDPALYAGYITISAALGDLLSIEKLAGFYKRGEGVKKDLVFSYKLYVRGARMGDPTCMAALADGYEWGRGCDKDPARARAWREKYWQSRYDGAKSQK